MMHIYLVTAYGYGILVQAVNAGHAYEQAVGFGLPHNSALNLATINRVEIDPAAYMLNTLRKRG